MHPDSGDVEGEIYHREFDVGQADPNVEIAETVAALENERTSELSPLYGCIDHIAEQLFSDPPTPEADAQISFTYEGYRVTLEQDGSARFRKLE